MQGREQETGQSPALSPQPSACFCLRGERDSGLATAQEIHRACPSVLSAVRTDSQGEHSAWPLWGPMHTGQDLRREPGHRRNILAGQRCPKCDLHRGGRGHLGIGSNADLASGGLGWAWGSAFLTSSQASGPGTKAKEMGRNISRSLEREPAGRRWVEFMVCAGAAGRGLVSKETTPWTIGSE